jgi:hypothetical protein
MKAMLCSYTTYEGNALFVHRAHILVSFKRGTRFYNTLGCTAMLDLMGSEIRSPLPSACSTEHASLKSLSPSEVIKA